MKYRVLEVLFGLVFLVGLYLFAHDTVADQINNLRQDRTLSDYQEAVSEASPETYEAEMQAALAHNAAITENTFAGDLFAGEGVQVDDEYNALLNLNGDGVMGMISIPKINQTIPIYHGTDDSVLQVGAGHLPGTALPVGGENTHCVLAAHRGLPSARLFSEPQRRAMVARRRVIFTRSSPASRARGAFAAAGAAAAGAGRAR